MIVIDFPLETRYRPQFRVVDSNRQKHSQRAGRKILKFGDTVLTEVSSKDCYRKERKGATEISLGVPVLLSTFVG